MTQINEEKRVSESSILYSVAAGVWLIIGVVILMIMITLSLKKMIGAKTIAEEAASEVAYCLPADHTTITSGEYAVRFCRKG